MSAEQDLANANVQIANLISEVTRFRDASMGINNLWPTITEGRQNTADGKYFSVPGDGAYLKLYRRAGSSQTLIAEFPDRAQVQGIVDVFGGRGVIGSGDLMAVGAYGIGLSGSYTTGDLNDFKTPGIYGITGQSALNAPGSFGNSTGVATLLVQGAGSYITQIFIGARSPGTGRENREVYSRVYMADTSSWSAWSRHYTSSNILGTVSQSGGVPTGAIIEQGSNANGEYTKFADGTLFMWIPLDFSTSSGSVGTGESIVINYPVRILSNSSTVLLATLDTAVGAWSITEERWKFDFGARTNTADYGNLQTRRKEAGSPCTGKFSIFVSARWKP